MPKAFYRKGVVAREKPRPRKMTKAQAGRLGGLAAADALTVEQRQLRASQGGTATKVNHSRDYFVRLAMKRWGYNVKPGERVP